MVVWRAVLIIHSTHARISGTQMEARSGSGIAAWPRRQRRALRSRSSGGHAALSAAARAGGDSNPLAVISIKIISSSLMRPAPGNRIANRDCAYKLSAKAPCLAGQYQRVGVRVAMHGRAHFRHFSKSALMSPRNQSAFCSSRPVVYQVENTEIGYKSWHICL